MVNLIIDTNTWIYMANGYNQDTGSFESGHHFKLVEKIADLVTQEKVEIIVNDIIIDEWKKNKVRTETLINKIQAGIDEFEKSINNSKKHVSPEGAKKADEFLNEYKLERRKEIQRNRAHISTVENLLFNKSTTIPITQSVKNLALDLALKKKAPFHKKNSMADALILFSAIEYFKEGGFDWIDNTFFVSNNTEDFCEKKGSSKIHPDLAAYLVQSQILFDTNLARVLNLSEDIIMEIDKYHHRLDSVHPCLAECDGMENGFLESGLAGVTFTEILVPIEGREIDYYNPNQIQLDLGDQYKLKKKDYLLIQNRNISRIMMGSCDFCGANHIECDCGEVHYSYDDEFTIECTCGSVIVVDGDNVKVSYV